MSGLRMFGDFMHAQIEADRVRRRAAEQLKALQKAKDDGLAALRRGVDRYPASLTAASEGMVTIQIIFGRGGVKL